MKYTINVTQEHIDRGRNLIKTGLHVKNCPVALAFKEIFPDQRVIVASSAYVTNAITEHTDIYLLPLEAKLFISVFDDRKTRDTVKPFTFEAELHDA